MVKRNKKISIEWALNESKKRYIQGFPLWFLWVVVVCAALSGSSKQSLQSLVLSHRELDPVRWAQFLLLQIGITPPPSKKEKINKQINKQIYIYTNNTKIQMLNNPTIQLIWFDLIGIRWYYWNPIFHCCFLHCIQLCLLYWK